MQVQPGVGIPGRMGAGKPKQIVYLRKSDFNRQNSLGWAQTYLIDTRTYKSIIWALL